MKSDTYLDIYILTANYYEITPGAKKKSRWQRLASMLTANAYLTRPQVIEEFIRTRIPADIHDYDLVWSGNTARVEKPVKIEQPHPTGNIQFEMQADLRVDRLNFRPVFRDNKAHAYIVRYEFANRGTSIHRCVTVGAYTNSTEAEAALRSVSKRLVREFKHLYSDENITTVTPISGTISGTAAGPTGHRLVEEIVSGTNHSDMLAQVLARVLVQRVPVVAAPLEFLAAAGQ